MNLQQITNAQLRLQAPNHQRLGTLTWWTLNGNRIAHDELVALAEKHGLEQRLVPKALKPTQAFRRACRKAASRIEAGQMLRKIADTPEEIVIGLVEELPNAAERDLEYKVLARIAFHKGTQKVSADLPHETVEMIRNLYRRHFEHSSDDIRWMISSFLQEAGVSCRQSGGVFFVPEKFQETLDALSKVVEEIGDNRIYQLPIFDTEEARSSLQEVAQRTFDDELRALETALETYDPDSVRSSTLERKLEEFDALRNRVNLFTDVLNFKAEGMQKRVETIRSGLRQVLDERSCPVQKVNELRSSASEFVPRHESNPVSMTEVGF